MGIRLGDRVDDGMIARRLAEPLREGIYVSEDYIRRHGLPIGPEDLLNHQLIGDRFITANRMLPLILNNGGEELTVDMPISLICNDTAVMADAIRQGLGIGRMFEPVHRHLPNRDELIPILEPFWRQYPAVYRNFPQNS